jgi:hypothetical protein
MSLGTRLQRATQSLSPLQRAVLVLQATREGREPDPELRRIDDEVQRRAFNRYMGLLWVANHHLGAIASITAYRVELAEQAAHYTEVFNQAAALIEEHNSLKPTRAVRDWRRKELTTAPELLRGLALERKDEALAQIEHLWKETLALESMWTELAEDFAGEDILLPEHRERHAESQERLRAAARTIGLRNLPASPDDEMLRACHETVAESFRHLGYSEV